MQPPLVYRHADMANMASHYMEQQVEGAENDTNITTALPLTSASVTPAELVNSSHLPCQWIMYAEINNSRVRVWDLIILLPNILFLSFLLLRIRIAVMKLQRTGSPIFFAFYGLVFLIAAISVLRCVVSMTVNAAVPAGNITDKALWLTLRFFMLAVELSVVTFGLAFGHLDSRTSIQRVLLVTFTIALAYSITQGVLEFMYKDKRFHVTDPDREYDIFGHGGMLFWFASSIFFCVIYSVICLLPCTSLRHRFALPTKKSFYYYSMFLALLNFTQAVGSGMLYYNLETGMCIVDVTTYLYFTCFAPLVYFTFLRDFFTSSQASNILFSYKAQVDDALEEDTVSLPQQIYNSGKLEVDITGPSSSYDSTHFDHYSPNPLYSSPHTSLNPGELSMAVDFSGSITPPLDDDIPVKSHFLHT